MRTEFFSCIVVLCSCVTSTFQQKLLVLIVEGLTGSQYYKFSHLPGFRTFQESGVWSTLLYPEFPTLPLPNRQALMTGLVPSAHGFVGDYMYNMQTGNAFHNFDSIDDFRDSLWWKHEPIYVTAQKAGAPAALFFFPECMVNWDPPLSICEPPRPDKSALDDVANVKYIIEATKSHDLVMVNHVRLRREIERTGPKSMRYKKSEEVEKLIQGIERLQEQVRERIDLNMIVVSPHGYIDVPGKNNRIFDEYVPMELINMTIGAGALKQIIAFPGKTHQVYSQLRHISPIPNVKIYYTAKNIDDIPSWYMYRRSDYIPDLVLIATPGYAVYTDDERKQIPSPSETVTNKGLSGYNNEYPDMLGIFLAYGPLFLKGSRKGPANLVDIYELMCAILRLHCSPSYGNLTNIDDIFVSGALRDEPSRPPSAIADSLIPSLFTLAFLTIFLLLRNYP